MRKNDEKELVKKFEIPETVRKVFDLKNQAIIGEEEKEKCLLELDISYGCQ